MRAVIATRTGGPEVLEVQEVDPPEPIPTEVLVRVHAAGVNPVDYKTRQGGGMAGVLGDPPYRMGWDVAGVVVQVGMGVTRFKPGDEVFGMPRFPREAGCYADYVTSPSRQLALRPEGLSFGAAAALPLASLTAWQALVETAGVQAGQRVLVHAAGGGVGHLAVQIAKASGAEVLGTASAAKLDFLGELGLDRPIDYESEAFEQVAAGVDVVLDLVGTKEYGLRSLECLVEGGLLIVVPSGADPEVIEAAEKQGKRATGILVEPDGGALERIAELCEQGSLTVALEEPLGLEEAARAHELGELGRSQGKRVLWTGA
ncbi:MAG: NADP-dependent oxidoreductase [Thermoleophilaceae bacterium]